MDFKVFQVFEVYDFVTETERLAEYLRTTNVFNGDHNLRYMINNDVEFGNGVIVGTLSQEYIPNSFQVDEDKNIRVADELEPYERTFFAFDTSTRALLVQNRQYSPANLNPGKALTRLTEIFGNAFDDLFEINFNPIPVLLPVGNDLFINTMNAHRVIELHVKNLNQTHIIRDGTQVLNNDTQNEALLNLWNNDASLLDALTLKCTNDGDLNDSFLANAAINTQNAEIELLKYYDPEEDGNVTLRRSQFDKFPVPNIDRNTESVTAFQEIINTVSEDRRILRRMRQF